MLELEPRWQWVEMPERVADDELPRSTYYLVDDGLVVAQVLYGGEDTAHEIVRALNEWDRIEQERRHAELRALRSVDQPEAQAEPVGDGRDDGIATG